MAEDKFSVNNYSVAYWRLRPSWTDALNLYEPLPETLSQYLFRYKSEDNQEFAERVKRLAQVNFVQYVIDYWVSMLFSTSAKIDSSDKSKDDVQRFISDCNGQGDTLFEYTRDIIAPTSFLFGVGDVVVDLPEMGESLVTQADEAELGFKNPYCYVIPPLNRTQWELDDRRNYKSFVSSDVINKQISASMNISDTKQYQRWTIETVIKYDDSGKEMEKKNNPYGFIPIVPVLYRNSQRFFADKIGISLVKDVVPIQKLILNLISLIFDYHEQTNFTQRYIVQDMADGAADNAPTQQEAMEMSNHRLTMLWGAGSKLGALTPDPAGVESMQGLLRQMVELLFLSCGLPSDLGENKTHQTEGTVRSNYSKLYNTLGNMARQFEKALRRIIETALRVQGYSDADIAEAKVTVQWDTNFSYQPFLSSIEELTALKAVMQDLSETAVKEFAKKTISAKLGNTAKWEEISEEIDSSEVNTAPVVPFAAPQNPATPENSALDGAANTTYKEEENELQ